MGMTIDLKDAILGNDLFDVGFDKMINHLDGHEVMVSAEGIIQNGQQIVVEREGMPIKGEIDQYGDLILTINIDFPK